MATYNPTNQVSAADVRDRPHNFGAPPAPVKARVLGNMPYGQVGPDTVVPTRPDTSTALMEAHRDLADALRLRNEKREQLEEAERRVMECSEQWAYTCKEAEGYLNDVATGARQVQFDVE